MDQVKQAMEGVQKYAFWIVSALTVILGGVGYWLSRTSMDKVFTAQSTKIEGQYSALNSIKNEVTKHPNSKSHEQMDKIINRLVDDVEAAWVKQYERQVKLLQWPRQALNERFVNKIEKYRPIELTLDYPLEKQPLTTADLNLYDTYFIEQFPRLAQIIGCKWVGVRPAVGQGAGGMMGMGGYTGGPGAPGMSGEDGSGGGMGPGGMMGGGPGGMMGGGPGGMMGAGGMMGGQNMLGTYGPDGRLIKPDLVVWPADVQTQVMGDVQTWRTKLPTTHDILYTQENIWILEGLLNIIAKANYGAVANFQCTVKRIQFLRIGRSAVTRAGKIDPILPAGGGMGPMGSMGSMGSEMGAESGDGGGGGEEGAMVGSSAGFSGGSGAEGEEGMAGGVVATPDPANGRYVDSAFKPLTGEDLRSKMKSSTPEDAYFAVAKRVPVRMRLIVDQRRLQALLAECGNADLMFEIRQVRIGDTVPAPAGGAGGGMGMGGMMGGSGGMGPGGPMGGPGMGAMGGNEDSEGGMGGMGMGGMGMGMGGMGGGSAAATIPTKNWDLPVEIYGVVYLFNPPDKEKLGLNKVTENTEVTDKVEVPADQVPQAAAPTDPVPGAADANAQQPAGDNAGQAQNGQAQNGQAQNGQAQNGQAQNGQAQNGQAPAGQQPADQQPNGQAPNSQVPNGQVPNGANGQTPNG